MCRQFIQKNIFFLIVSICGSSAESDIKSNCNPPGTDYILINECLINWEDWVTTKNDTDKNHSIRNDSDDDSPSNSKTSGHNKDNY